MEELKRDKAGRFIAGTVGNPGGVPKGLRELTNKIKTAYLEAFEDLGGKEEFVKWIQKAPKNREKFYELVLKVLPREIIGEGFGDRFKLIIFEDGKPLTNIFPREAKDKV